MTLLLWVPQRVWSSRQDTAESVSCQKLDVFVSGVLWLQVLPGLCCAAAWANQVGRSVGWSRGDESKEGA